MKSMKEMIQEWDIKEILNEGADLNVPVKMAKKSLSKLVSQIENHKGGSFDAGSQEYSLTEGNPDLYGDRYRNLVQWEQKVHTIAQLDSFAEKLVEVKMSAEGKVTWLSDKIRDMRKQSDVLFEMAKSKRFNK